jgi:hypothetical protein
MFLFGQDHEAAIVGGRLVSCVSERRIITLPQGILFGSFHVLFRIAYVLILTPIALQSLKNGWIELSQTVVPAKTHDTGTVQCQT